MGSIWPFFAKEESHTYVCKKFMIELQEDEVDDNDTSTIDEVSFPANLSFASYLKMAKNTWQTRQKNKLQKT